MKLTLAASLAMAAVMQSSTPPSQSPAISRPFVVGERATYDVHFNVWFFGKVGTGTLSVPSVDTIRGRDAYKLELTITGGIPGYKIRDTLISWADTATFQSLRFVKDQEESGKNETTRIEILGERGVFRENNRPEKPTVAEPLDDISFLFFARSLDLTVGQKLSFDRYFRPDRNPVRLNVLRKDTITVPAGRFKTIVVQPIIKARGVFSEGGHAEVWIADDSTRAIVQIKTGLKFGTLTMKLTSYRRNAVAPLPRR